MKLLSLTLPNPNPTGQTIPIVPPAGVPTGGLEAGGAGQRLFQLGVDGIFAIGVILAVIFIIISGIQWIISGGDKQKLQAARTRLIYSIVGLIVIIGAFFIVSTVIVIFGGNPSFFLPKP